MDIYFFNCHSFFQNLVDGGASRPPRPLERRGRKRCAVSGDTECGGGRDGVHSGAELVEGAVERGSRRCHGGTLGIAAVVAELERCGGPLDPGARGHDLNAAQTRGARDADGVLKPGLRCVSERLRGRAARGVRCGEKLSVSRPDERVARAARVASAVRKRAAVRVEGSRLGDSEMEKKKKKKKKK
jgi:hypothetical protein